MSRQRPVGISAPTSASPTLGWGVAVGFPDLDPKEQKRFDALRAAWARIDVPWSRIEPARGVFDFSTTDRLFDRIGRAGAGVLWRLTPRNPAVGAGPDTPPPAFASLVAAIAKRYAGKRLALEIADNGSEPKDLVGLARAAADALDRSASLIPLFGVAQPGESERLVALLRAGLAEVVDALSLVLTDDSPDAIETLCLRTRGLIARHAPRNRTHLPIVFSGLAGESPKDFDPNAAALRYLSAAACRVPVGVLDTWEPSSPDRSGASLLAPLAGYTLRHRLASGPGSSFALLFQRGDSPELRIVHADSSQKHPVRIETVAPGTARHAALADLCRLEFPADFAVARSGPAGWPTADVVGAEWRLRPEPRRKRRVVIDIRLPGQESRQTATVAAGKAHRGRWVTAVPLDRSVESLSARIEIRIDGRPLPAIHPLRIVRADPLRLACVGSPGALRLRVDDPAAGGLVAILDDGARKARITLGKGVSSGTFPVTPGPNGRLKVTLTSVEGLVLARFGPAQIPR